MADDDKELAQYLLGKWTEVHESPGLIVTLTHTHNKDGSWRLDASANYDQGAAHVNNSATGRWRIEDGCLITTVEASDVEVMQAGDTYSHDVLIAAEGELHLMDGTGATSLRTKLATSQAVSTAPAAVDSSGPPRNVIDRAGDDDVLWDIFVNFTVVTRSTRGPFLDALRKVTALDLEPAAALLKSGQQRQCILRGIPYSEARAIERRLTEAGGYAWLEKSKSGARREIDVTESDVLLTSVGANRIHVLKRLCEITKLSMNDVKALVDAVASGPQHVSRARGDEVYGIRKYLEEAGASVDIQPVSDVSDQVDAQQES